MGRINSSDSTPELASIPAPDRRNWAILLLPVLAALIAFAPALRNGFVEWDDYTNFLRNDGFRGLDGVHLRWAWSTFHLGVYQPLAWMLLEAQYALWGLDPWGYHLTSLVLHAAEAAALYALAVALMGRCRAEDDGRGPWPVHLGAGLAVALFVAHPLRTEVVAWASCQPYLPCALFATLAVLAYLHAHPRGGPSRVGWGIAAFLLCAAAMLSKAAAVSLPAVLLILDIYPLRRIGNDGLFAGPEARRAWAEKLPYFALAAVFVVLAVLARRHFVSASMSAGVAQGPLGARLAKACYGACFYLEKTVWPFGLAPHYPPPRQIAWTDPRFFLSGILVAGLSVTLFLMRRRLPGLLAAWAGYLAILAPSSGLVRSFDQIAADRYSFLAMMGLVVLVAAGLSRIMSSRLRASGVAAVGLVLLAGLTALSWRQCTTWHDSLTLWRQILAHADVPDPKLHNYGGMVLLRAGETQAALEQFARVVRDAPDYAPARANLGLALIRLDRYAEAEAQLAEAVRLQPDDVDARVNLSVPLVRQGKLAEAEAQLAEAILRHPDHFDARRNLGVILFQQGKLAGAEAQLAAAVRIQPDNPEMRKSLGAILFQQGKLAEAEVQFTEALKANPDDASARGALAEIARRRRVDRRSGGLNRPGPSPDPGGGP